MTDKNEWVIFIKNIPYDINENGLSEWCMSFGPVKECSLKRDRFGHSRGFAFVSFANIDGYSNILSSGPHSCLGRPLIVKSANEQKSSNDSPSYASDQQSQATSFLSTNDNFSSTTVDNGVAFDDENQNHLANLRDELEANLECLQIAHDHEVKILSEKLAKEKKLYQDALESYKDVEENLTKVREDNIRIRTSLIKNVMQTFNIRRNLARQIKEQINNCSQIEGQCDTLRQQTT
ncbi:unnamed protein product [Adineta ricciae]|uniref:RRM domain-containing protein n=1 Tax=Adineta ricciae TaxID=249248 RepID=A0A813QZK6_ADIRI|nr:unnamed protein product [Adineta ricciae]CAF1154137.1 unnamed protein product [Adineta ricciae]